MKGKGKKEIGEEYFPKGDIGSSYCGILPEIWGNRTYSGIPRVDYENSYKV